VSVGTFSAVDASAEAHQMICVLDRIAALAGVQRLKGAATDLLAPASGQRLVDVGCGTGEDARALATYVGPEGRVIGIDPSETMLNEARRRTTRALALEYRLGDATELPLDDASVDGCRSERVFQYLAAPESALAELVRVTRPDGRIVVVDTDWGMHALHGADPNLTDTILEVWTSVMANGRSARRLPGLFRAAGMDPMIHSETFVSTDGAVASGEPFTFMAVAAAAAEAISADEADVWLAQLADAGRRGEFFWAATMFAVGARRPC
jgi:ubiquinone/menaquinone biosynthesis C-methylase UbiE